MSERPLLRIVRGTPTDEELAAVTAVVAALAAVPSPPPPRARPLWTDRTALLHAPLLPGKGSWRASGLPR
ncbi:acyl-CoA carboxylase epsilon subunit [Fodinicola acaciae]|uniref:acyl-CoA carboxylase epsilon subunit n=1 Tax=Fodinicola acaciae TaxID=2681555 RepID=UPI0013D76F44|nr:acyl-CoA carboxylase epsilon subunit [Fodinicola acaciae]